MCATVCSVWHCGWLFVWLSVLRCVAVCGVVQLQVAACALCGGVWRLVCGWFGRLGVDGGSVGYMGPQGRKIAKNGTQLKFISRSQGGLSRTNAGGCGEICQSTGQRGGAPHQRHGKMQNGGECMA
uniref:Uncharacterized protein n=1 Tax=Eutreptiella gymnastica TaxID=73025 RepID=A0A7S4GA64_9EUGL